jgi:hypothetical protein
VSPFPEHLVHDIHDAFHDGFHRLTGRFDEDGI